MNYVAREFEEEKMTQDKVSIFPGKCEQTCKWDGEIVNSV